MITKTSHKNMPSKMAKAEPLRPVQVYLPVLLWRQVKVLATVKGMQARDLVSLALSEFLKNNKA